MHILAGFQIMNYVKYTYVDDILIYENTGVMAARIVHKNIQIPKTNSYIVLFWYHIKKTF